MKAIPPRHPLIFDNFRATCFEEAWGRARLYEFHFVVVTFERISDKNKRSALALGFSPPLHLERLDERGYSFYPDSETAQWALKEQLWEFEFIGWEL